MSQYLKFSFEKCSHYLKKVGLLVEEDEEDYNSSTVARQMQVKVVLN